MAYVEVYPQRFVPSQRDPGVGRTVTDHSRFGSAAHYAQPIRPGAVNEFDLRLPTRYEHGGSTGYLEGRLDYRGQPIPVDLGCDRAKRACDGITRLRAFARGRGPECGIEGSATGPDSTGPDSTGPDTTGPDSTGPDSTGPDTTGPDSTGPDSTGRSDHYRIDALAGGRCGAPAQAYTIFVDCVTFCGGGPNAVRGQALVAQVPSRCGGVLNVSWR